MTLSDHLHEKKRFRRERASSWDRSGGNVDYVEVAPGATHAIEPLAGPGIIRHIWMTMRSGERDLYRKTRLQIAFDGAASPQVDAPVADFFLFGHGILTDVNAAPIQVSRQPHLPEPPGRGALNCAFPMPFAREARVTLVNNAAAPLVIYYYVDWESDVQLPEPVLHFHATFHEERTEPPDGQCLVPHGDFDLSLRNASVKENYVLLDARDAEGHYVGTGLSIDAPPDGPGKWWEGDDMFVIDGEPWPPRLHGTGTEDYFNLAWGFRKVECRPEYGVTWMDRAICPADPLAGQFSMYRFHLNDPIPFERSLLATLEHGHANDCRALYRSVAFWYGRGFDRSRA